MENLFEQFKRFIEDNYNLEVIKTSKEKGINFTDIFGTSFKEQCYVCSKCGEIQFPIIEWIDGEMNIVNSKGQVRSGKGNTTIKDNICDKCMCLKA